MAQYRICVTTLYTIDAANEDIARLVENEFADAGIHIDDLEIEEANF